MRSDGSKGEACTHTAPWFKGGTAVVVLTILQGRGSRHLGVRPLPKEALPETGSCAAVLATPILAGTLENFG